MYTSAETGMPLANFLQPKPVEMGPVERRKADEKLKADLRATMTELPLGNTDEGPLPYNNAEVAARIQPDYTERELGHFERFLDDEGTFDVPITWRVMEIEGVKRKIPLVAATELGTDHGDMSSMIYLRDQIQTARSYMELALKDPERYKQKGEMGRLLLQSSLHLMSTPHQLGRANELIAMRAEPTQANHPFISFLLDDLEATEPNGWRNDQDSSQMLVDLTFDAINRGFITPDDLTESHKAYLSTIVPLMNVVKFPEHSCSGTWEEFRARRTSVLSVETPMLHKMKIALEGPHAEKLAFLQESYAAHGGKGWLAGKLNTMVRIGLEELGRRWPYESPDYARNDIKYREADAALTYGLMYGVPELFEAYETPLACAGGRVLPAVESEKFLLEQVDSLMDSETGAMKRYLRDSYLRRDFLLNEAQANVAGVKMRIARVALRNNREPDLEAKQRLRDGVVPKGREAAWPHPVAQLSAWAARREMQVLRGGQSELAEYYRRLSIKYLNQSSRSITGANQHHIVRNKAGGYEVRQVAAFKMPEAMITYGDEGSPMIVPSPHTQLNWAAATQGEAFAMCRVAARAANAHRLGECSIDRELAA